MNHDKVLAEILGRSNSLFQSGVQAASAELNERINRSRILVLGAGGSIGSSFVEVLAGYRPRALHLVDLSENSLVRLVRDLHARGVFPKCETTTHAVGFESTEFYALLAALPSIDYILNFAALKHVRSERDPFTAMRLLDTNVLANDRLLTWWAKAPPSKFFCVSSDKAVNPASLMGASKALMERVGIYHSSKVTFGSARFANVAFSDGSLLQSFVERLQKQQPLAGPSDIKRYFISHREAGELCLLSAFLGENNSIFTPLMDPGHDLKNFPEIAELILRANGYIPRHCASEEEAIEVSKQRSSDSKEWPCFFAPSNTAGEKPFEEFYVPEELPITGKYENIAVVTCPRRTPEPQLKNVLNGLNKLKESAWDLVDLINEVRHAVPEFAHVESSSNLDQKL